MKKILFTGAHFNSALVVLDELKFLFGKNEIDVQFIWVGQKLTKSNKLSPEYQEVSRRGVIFEDIKSGKIYRTTSIRFFFPFLFNLLLIPVGFVRSLFILLKHNPEIIVSFGGYIAVPIVVMGKILGIRSVTHEQTAVVGLANRFIARFADCIYTSWPAEYYSNSEYGLKKNVIYTGLPIRSDFVKNGHLDKFIFNNKLPVIYVTGGKAGSQFINLLVKDNLEKLLEKFNIIWSCGTNSGLADYKDIQTKISTLPLNSSNQIILKEYFFEEEILKVFNSSNLVLTRGGAHTIYELALLKKPAIIIPIPWASNNEQYLNAKILAEIGLAEILDQEKLDNESFVQKIFEFIKNIDRYRRLSLRSDPLVKTDAGRYIANDIFEKVNKSK